MSDRFVGRSDITRALPFWLLGNVGHYKGPPHNLARCMTLQGTLENGFKITSAITCVATIWFESVCVAQKGNLQSKGGTWVKIICCQKICIPHITYSHWTWPSNNRSEESDPSCSQVRDMELATLTALWFQTPNVMTLQGPSHVNVKTLQGSKIRIFWQNVRTLQGPCVGHYKGTNCTMSAFE